MSFADPQSPTEMLMAHSAYTKPDHIDCECGWVTPDHTVQDPRTAHARHVNEMMAEKFAVIPRDIMNALGRY